MTARDIPDAAMAACLVAPGVRTPEQWRDACAAMDTTEGLDDLRRRLSSAGQLDSAAMAAIRDRMEQLNRGQG